MTATRYVLNQSVTSTRYFRVVSVFGEMRGGVSNTVSAFAPVSGVRVICEEARMGSIIGLSATMILTAQTALYYLAAFTNYYQQFCLPLVSNGNAMLLLAAVLVGLILSALRGEALPEKSAAYVDKRLAV